MKPFPAFGKPGSRDNIPDTLLHGPSNRFPWGLFPGFATFTHDLCEAIATSDLESECFVVAVNDRPDGYDYPKRVHFEIQEKDLGSYRRAADFLNFSTRYSMC